MRRFRTENTCLMLPPQTLPRCGTFGIPHIHQYSISGGDIFLKAARVAYLFAICIWIWAAALNAVCPPHHVSKGKWTQQRSIALSWAQTDQSEGKPHSHTAISTQLKTHSTAIEPCPVCSLASTHSLRQLETNTKYKCIKNKLARRRALLANSANWLRVLHCAQLDYALH